MTRNNLLRRVWFTVLSLVAYAVLGVILRAYETEAFKPWYDIYRDMIPLAIAGPAAYLGYVFQQRGSYLQSLRDLWHQLIPAVHRSIHFVQNPNRNHAEYATTMVGLSTAIDSLRGVFDNIPKAGTLRGLYPFENLKDILSIVEWVGYDKEHSEEEIQHACRCIANLWGEMHGTLLLEFDRDPPIEPVSKYLHPAGKSIADKLLEGELNPEHLARDSKPSNPDA